MWTRAELKRNAKAGLKNYFWMAVLVMIISGAVGWLVSGIVALIPFVNMIATPLVLIFFNNVVAVGACSYFVKSTRNGADAGMGELFSGFQGDRFIRIVSVQLFRDVFVALWSMLFVIPGIIKHYEYYMVGYLAAEYPEKERKEIFQISKQMMKGNKLKTFLLEFSFIGWMFLGTLACGIGLLFVMPYMSATLAELYLKLKEECFGIPRNGAVQNYESAGYISGGVSQITQQNIQSGENGAKKGFLVGVQGHLAGSNIPVEIGEILKVGSDVSQCNVIVKGEQVARLHMTVEFDGNLFRVADYSAYGTFVQYMGQIPTGQAVILQRGSYIQLGTNGDIFMLDCR